MMRVTKTYIILKRQFSKFGDKDRSAKAIRQKFIDYFVNKHGHNFVKSSPVVPFCDPTVAFVNAGMNQFKGIFLGTHEPQFKRAANSQKCVRVGGKHNDLDAVGSDGYHHTFFEMLGNWSFGDYFKKEACELAWNLLVNEYKIPSSRLYVTYFKGDEKLGLQADVETKEIWKAIGVPDDRILPFSSKDNFWEMGLTGPCGPCTEIHIDHLTTKNRSNLVNKGLHDLTELWNLVFIQYKRKENRTIELLPKKHVDTGMGFERLTAVLQGKISNYDTDNFRYLFRAIQKNCSKFPMYEGKFGESDWNNLDASYRILADHARMVTVCLSDGMIPEENQKLRRVMRKAFIISETVFLKESGLLKELSNYVIEQLGPVYPELEKNVKHIQQIIDYEEEVYKEIRKSSTDEWNKLAKLHPNLAEIDIIESPGVVAAFKEIKSTNPKRITEELAFKLSDTFGLEETNISKLAKIFNLPFDLKDLQKQLENAKFKSKAQHQLTNSVIYDKLNGEKVPKTDTTQVYNYTKDKKNKYVFDKTEVKILKILQNLDIIPQVGPEIYCTLILNKTNLYSEAGGQKSDQGTILFDGYLFEVTETQNCNGYIMHKGFLHAGKNYYLKAGDVGIMYVDPEFRTKTMRNHTGVHLLNAAVKQLKGATCQKSSKVTENYLNLDVGIFSEKLSMKDIEQIQQNICGVIQSELPVDVKVIDGVGLSECEDVTLIPGEVYPEKGVRLIQVEGGNFVSKEPCCGTHVENTGDLKDFCIIGCKSLGRSTMSLHAVTGDRAKIARANGVEIVDNIEQFEKTIRDNFDKPEMLNMVITSFKQRLNYEFDDSSILPLTIKHNCIDSLNKLAKQIKESSKSNFKEFIDIEMKNALESNISVTKNNQKYMIHYLRSSLVLDNVPLQKATKVCADIPVIVISYADNMVKARCCVPKKFSKTLNAEKWLKDTVATVFKSNTAPPKGQDGSTVCNMKAKRVSIEDWDLLLQESIKAAKNYIEEHL